MIQPAFNIGSVLSKGIYNDKTIISCSFLAALINELYKISIRTRINQINIVINLLLSALCFLCAK